MKPSNHSINNPHDAFFKQSMQQPVLARQFMQYYLPANMVAKLNLATLTHLNTTYIHKQLSSTFSDVVFSCELAGEPATISLLVEHQSKPDKFMPVRVGYYLFSLLSRQIKETKGELLPAAYCMVFYHGKKYPYSMHLADCFDDPLGLMKNLFSHPIPLIDVSELPEEQLRQQRLIGIMAQIMKHIRDADISPFLYEFFDRFQGLPYEDQQQLDFVMAVLEYAVQAGNTGDEELDRVIEHANQSSNHTLGESVMTIAELLRQRGLKQGLQQGLEQGVAKGAHQNKIETAQRLLDRGFSVTEAADISGLPEAQVAELAKAH